MAPEPGLNGGSDELAAIVGPDMRRRTALDEQLGERCQHVLMVELAGDRQRQAFSARLVDDRENAELAPVVGASFNKVVSPHMPGYSGRSRMHDPSFS